MANVAEKILVENLLNCAMKLEEAVRVSNRKEHYDKHLKTDLKAAKIEARRAFDIK